MTTPATALLADFDFNLTPHSQTPSLIPRPPTPDPRRTPTPHPPRRFNPPLPTDEGRKRLRKKPTAIFVGNEPRSQAPPCPVEAKPLFDLGHSSHHTLPSLLPHLPSTPSPRFATSPSLSSSGTTVQSSPTLTPTTGYFARSYSELQPDTKGPEAFSNWNYNQGKLSLRRAKRLPHREQGLWEVHAVVHVDEDSRDCGGSGIGKVQGQGPSQHKHYEWCIQQQQRQAGFPVTSLPPESDFSNSATTEKPSAQYRASANHNGATHRDTKVEGFHGIHSESTRRESGLGKIETVESSSFSLSKYHFPAPPGDYRIGLSGDLQHPTKVHYRGASFDLVNPHASLLLSSSQLETPGEIDGLLDNYFEDPDAMPRALYTDPETARRDIMRLDGAGEPAQAAISSNETSATSLVPTRVPSDPFDLRITDVPSQAAQTILESVGGGADTLAEIVGEYDYTRDTPFEHEETLRALESGLQESHSEEVFQQLPEDVQHHMSAELAEKTSELPTSDGSYGDTGQLLGLTPKHHVSTILPNTMPFGAPEARIRPAPGRSTTETTITDSELRSAAASLHGAESALDSPDSRSTQRARGGVQVHAGCREISSNTLHSDGDGDWETTRSESHVGTFSRLPRASEESYANTSTYNEANRLSAMSDATIAGKQSYRPYRAAPTLPSNAGANNEEDVNRARKALEKIYKDKVLEQNMISGLIGNRSVPRETRRKDRVILQGLRDRRESAILQAYDNDIELEGIRKKNPQAVRQAADELYVENALGQLLPQRAAMPLGRLRGVFSRNRSTAEQLMNRDIMNEAIAEENSRERLARTPTTVCSSRLAFSESANTFRTFRDVESPSPSERNSRAALDYGGRPFSPSTPAAVYTPDRGRVRQLPGTLESRHHERNKAPQRPARRAAMSSQTSLRALITSGSPTSNIQGAFTDREMAEASRRWYLVNRHDQPQRHGRNASGPFPRLHGSPLHRSDVEGRMLLRPSESMDPSTLLLQEVLSKRYLIRILAFPPLCLLFYNGHYDHLIAKKTNGLVKVMSPSRKEDALSWAVLLTIIYVLIIVGTVVAVAIATGH